ncbi:MAG: ATP-binding protein [Egibacteraceae bacterium]
MRLPARAIAGHFVWSREGSVWAVYGVEPAAYPYLPGAEKLRLHARLRAAFMVLPPDSMLLSVCRRIDPGEVVQRMVDGIDLGGCPAWRDEAASTLEDLLAVPLYDRRHYLAVRLADRGLRSALTSLAAARTAVAEHFAVPAAPVHRRDLDARRRQAELFEARITGILPLRRVGSGELRWLYARAVRRGVHEPYLDEDWGSRERVIGDGDAARVAGPALQALGDAVFYEGGSHDDVDRPAHRRYLRVDTLAGTGYQTLLAVADMPREFTFPGGAGEWFRKLDHVDFPVDWCARVTAVANQDAQLKARKQARQLAGQFEQYDGETSGAPQDLAEAARGVDEERAELAGNKGEPELQTTLLFAVGANTLADLEARAEQLQSLFIPADYGLARPTGGQLALFSGMLPGSPMPAVARDYTQYLLPRDLAAGAPFAGHSVGDPRGMLLGVSLDAGGVDRDGNIANFTPVLFDPAYGPSVNRSGSIGVAGNLGSGKSYFNKRCMHAVLARGGQVVTLDRTDLGEYVAFAEVAPAPCQVVRLAAESSVCLDPLQVFRGDDRVTFTIGFLTLLTQVSPSDLEGALLAEAVRTVAERPGGTLRDVVAELEAAADSDPDARVVARKLANYARNRLAGLAFDTDGRDLLTLDADYIVFHTPGLSLPRREELLNEHLARQLLPEQLFSQALLYLVAAIARKVAFDDASRFGIVALDEVWALTSSMQGRQLILDLIRDGRKHNAAVWLLSQHADDLGDDQLAHLLGSRFVFRQDAGAVPAAVRFLGIESSPAVTELLDGGSEAGLQSGQCLYRDGRGRVGHILVLPAGPQLDAAFNTNPAARQHQSAVAGPAPVDSDGAAPAAVAERPDPLAARAGAESEIGTPPPGVLDDIDDDGQVALG